MNTSTLDQNSTTERFHGLDAARAIALLIGIFHHGIESFVTYAKHDWITQDSQSSLLIDILFYVSHVFRMQSFFLMSGFFAHLLFHRKGPREFMLNRGKRLLLPFILFWPVLYATTWNLWVWGVQYSRQVSYEEAVKSLPAYMVWDNGFPLMHLWFLWFLIVFCTCVILVHPIVDRLDSRRGIRRIADSVISYLLNRWWGSLAIGLVMVMPMLGMTDWFGVDTSASGLVPELFPFIIYGLYFTLGWFLHRQATLVGTFRRFKGVNLIMSFLTIGTVIIVSLLFSEPTDPADAALALMSVNTLYAFASITTVFAFIGYMLHWFSGPNRIIRYLADGAYWGYLIHLPIIAFFQIIVAPWDMIWPLKLIIIFLPGGLILWASYQYGVRSTWIGQLPEWKEGWENAGSPRTV